MTKPINKTVKYFSYIIFAFLATFIIGISSAMAWDMCYYSMSEYNGYVSNSKFNSNKIVVATRIGSYATMTSDTWNNTETKNRLLTVSPELGFAHVAKYINNSSVKWSSEDYNYPTGAACPQTACLNPGDSLDLHNSGTSLDACTTLGNFVSISWEQVWGSPMNTSHLQTSAFNAHINDVTDRLKNFKCTGGYDECIAAALDALKELEVHNAYGLCAPNGTLDAAKNTTNTNEWNAKRTLCDEFMKYYKELESGKLFEGCGFFTQELLIFFRTIYFWIVIGGLVLTIVLGIMDFIKAAASHEGDANKKAGSKFVKRLIASILLILIPVLIDFTLSISGYDWIPDEPTCIPFK